MMIKKLKKRLGFGVKSYLADRIRVPPNDLLARSDDRAEEAQVAVRLNEKDEGAYVAEGADVAEGAYAPEGAYVRDLSLGGAVLVGLGAKKVLLPALLLGHPVLFAISASTSAVTGYRYLRGFWDGMRGEGDMDGETLAGTASVATLAFGHGVGAVAGVWLLNLGGYLQARPSAPRLVLTPRTSGHAPAGLPGGQENPSQEPPLKIQFPTERIAKLLTLASLGVSGASVGYYLAPLPMQLAQIGTINELLYFLSTSHYGPLLYMLFYAAQPPFIFSETLLSIAGGLLFGPVRGLLYAMIGSNGDALIAYFIGRRVGPRLLDEVPKREIVAPYTERMRENSFESLLIMRLLYLPHDLVSGLAGALEINWRPFLLATTLGSLPSTMSWVLLGASIEGTSSLSTLPRLNPSTFAASGVILVSSLALSRYLQREEEQDEDEMTENVIYLGAS